MFQIGEFSKIARISTRQLRHYDEIGLFKPLHIDPQTGYRYYSAEQLPQLNRILALKDLGLTLDQIARLITENISAEEIHGMLTLKKAQIEQALQDELVRVRGIEERIYQIETEGVLSDDDVVLKRAPAQKYLSVREVVPTIRNGFALMYEIHRLLPHQTERGILGQFALTFHSEGFETEQVDVEMGYLLDGNFLDNIPLSDGRRLTIRTLPPIEKMATLARVGIFNDHIGHYGAVGMWIERQGYEVAGVGREVFIEPFIPGHEDTAVVEIQIPVRHAANIFQGGAS